MKPAPSGAFTSAPADKQAVHEVESGGAGQRRVQRRVVERVPGAGARVGAEVEQQRDSRRLAEVSRQVKRRPAVRAWARTSRAGSSDASAASRVTSPAAAASKTSSPAPRARRRPTTSGTR